MDRIKNSPNSEGAEEPAADLQPMQIDMPLDDPNDLQRVSPWALDFRQVQTGRLHTRLSYRARDGMSVLRLNMSAVVHQRGQSPSEVITFAIPRTNRLRQWHGAVANAQTLFGFGSGSEFDCVSDAGFEADVLSLDRARFEASADRFGFVLADEVLHARLWDTSECSQGRATLSRQLANLMQMSVWDWPPETMDDVTIAVLSLLTTGEEHADKSPFRARHAALQRALAVMETTLDDPLPLPQICRLSGASWRTLDRAFKENFDIGPKTYYLRLRLNRARQGLLRPEPQTKVGEVANLNGFWHMGQFARDYRKLFGELPSETVRAGKDQVIRQDISR